MSSELRKILNSSRSTVPFRNWRKESNKAQTPFQTTFSPKANLLCQIKIPKGNKVENWEINGRLKKKPHIFHCVRKRGGMGYYGYKLTDIPIQNWEQGITIEGRLNNGNLTSWSHHAVGVAVAPSWENHLGFHFL